LAKQALKTNSMVRHRARKPEGPLRGGRPFFFAFLLAGCLGGCSSPPMVDLAPSAVPQNETVVTINGEPISLDDFDNEFRLMWIHYSAVTGGGMQPIKRRLFEQVINRRLLVQTARKAGLKLTQAEVSETFRDAAKEMPEDFPSLLKSRGVSEEAWKRKLLQERLARKLVEKEVNSKVKITRDEAEEYYWTHLPEYWRQEAVRARHLVVKKPTEWARVTAALKNGEDFQKVTSALTEGPEKNQGGDWGYLNQDRIPPAYLEALSGLQPGEVSLPVQDGFGHHLFQLIQRRPRVMQSFAQVSEAIRGVLTRQEEELRFNQWMENLKRKAAIKVNKAMAPNIGVSLEHL
jgi:peptidyl-prolyl cis-trans isomerase C